MSPSSTKNASAILILSIALCGHAAGALADEATVLWTDGEAQMQPPGSETLESVAAGAAVPEGSRLITPENTSCGIGFEGPLAESTLTLKPATSTRITSLGESAQIELEQGALFIKLAKLKKDSQFSVRTPTAIASARGTGWYQSLDQVEVFEGTVSLKNNSGQEEVLSQDEAYDLGSDGLFATKRPAADENRAAWETFGQRAVSSPYFNRITADNILNIRQAIDARRKSGACGSAGAYPWNTTVEPGAVITPSQINELKTALTEPPFVQSPEFVENFLDPVPTVRSGEPVRASTIRLLLEAAENASC